MSNEKLEIFNRAQSTLLAIPGHAKHYEARIDAMRAQVLADAGKSPEELNLMLDRDEEMISDYTYISKCGVIFRTLALLPSPETVAVLGRFLNDPEGRDGKTLLGNVMNSGEDDDSWRPSNAENAAMAMGCLGIEHPPVRPPVPPSLIHSRETAPAEEIDAWKDWWNEVKAGKRTYRFAGSPVEYGPDGPVSAEKLQAIERDRRRDAARAAGRDGPAADSPPSAAPSPLARPGSIAVLLAACAIVAGGALWCYLRPSRG